MKSNITYIRPNASIKRKADLNDIVANIVLIGTMFAGFTALLLLLASF